MSQRLYHSILFIDARVPDADALLAGVADGVRVVRLSADGDGVQQIAAALQSETGLDSIEILSHGASGALQLGNTVLDADSLAARADLVRAWGAALRDGGDVLLYGCDVGQGETGLAFVNALAALTGADVAASTDVTGSSLLGANWALELATGSIEAGSALAAQAQDDYAHTLALVNNGAAGTITFNTNSDVTVLNATGLAAGAVVNVSNLLGTGFDLYTQSSNGGSVTVLNANGTSLLGIPVTDDRLTVNGSLLSPVNYVDLRANSGVFDMLSMKIGSGNLVGNLVGNVVFTVYALDANYQPTGPGVSVVGLVVNEYGLLNFASMANFKGIFGIRIVNPLGFEVGIDDIQVANGRAAPAITSGAYNAASGTLTITAANINAGDLIDTSKLTINGQGGSYTLTSGTVSAASGSSIVITLNAADKLAIAGVLNNNGTAAVDGTAFNISAALNWDSSRPSGQDLTGNPVTVSNVQLPTISSASYDATSHVLTVSGSNLVALVGANNDITVSKLTLRGEGGASYTLSTTGNVEVTNNTTFAVTLTGADIAAIAALLNKNGTAAVGGAAYVLSAGDDWNTVIGNTNTAVAGVGVTVNNVINSAPTITGTGAVNVGDNATINPFANITVADVDGDTVSMTISYNSANGTLSGAGLSGSAGNYTMNATSAAALSAQLKALVFTPTANQVAVGNVVNTGFSLVATDSKGAASTVNTGAVVNATSINDAPVISGVMTGQAVAAGGTVRPFANVVISDADFGASMLITIVVTQDAGIKGLFTPASVAAAGFVTNDGGLTYTHTSAAPGAAQAALQQLVFQPTPGQNATSTFTISVNDGYVTVNNNATTVVATVPSSTTALSVLFSADSGVSNTDLITNVAAQTISGTLSANLQSGERVEVSYDNGASWITATASVGGAAWSLAGQTLTGSGALQVRVSNSAGSSTPLSVNYTLDTTAPTNTGASFAFSADSGASSTDLITKSAQQTVSGTLSNSLAADEHVEVSFNNGSTWTTASASAGSNTWLVNGVTLTGSNTMQVRVVDAAGNAGAATSAAYVLDTTGPTATMSTNVSVAGAGQAVAVTVTFSETPYGLSLASFNGVNGVVSNLRATADPKVYLVDYTPNGGIGGVLGGVQLVSGTYTDVAGNSGAAASAVGVAVTLGPTVNITSSAASLNASQTATITFSFSSLPVGFTSSDVSVSGGSLGPLVNQGGGIYTALFTPAANYAGPASITVAGGSYTDGIGLSGGSGVSPALAVDTVIPTVAITSTANSLKLGDSTLLTFTFSEAPVGFTAGDVVVSNGAISNLVATANPLVYTAVLTPNAGVAAGTASVSIAPGSYTDAAGNAGVGGSAPPIAVDTVAPLAVGTGISFSADNGVSSTDLVTNVAAQNISGTLSTPLAADETVQVSLDGVNWINASATAGNAGWSLAGATLNAGGTLQVRVIDGAGNTGPVFSANYVLDTSAPTVTVASTAATLGVGQTSFITFTFSEVPANFSLASLSVSGGVVSGLAATNNPLVYQAVFTPTPGQTGGAASVAVNAGGYTDAAGNSGQAGAPVTITANTAVPTVQITSSDSVLASGETATLTFAFSTAPVGFTINDIAVGNGTLGNFTATADPLVYTVQFTPNPGVAAATASVALAAGAYADVYGNSGSAATSLPIAIDTVAPTLTISSSSAAVKAGDTALITFTFSEVPVGFNAGSIVTTGGSLSGLAPTANPLVYTAVFTPNANTEGINAGFSLAGAVTDAAGNAVAAPVAPPLAIDTLAPTITTATVLFSADSGSSATDLVTNVAAQTISGTLGAALGAGETVEVSLDNGLSWTAATGSGTAWSLAGQTLAGSNVLQVRVTDSAGNDGPVFAQAYVLDTSAPTATVGASTGALKSGETALVTMTFSEVPVGFTLADLSVSGGTLSGFTATANPLVYTVVFTPTSGVNGGSGVVSITGGSYTDKAGNAGAAASLPAIAIDTQAPTTTGASVSFSNDSGNSNSDLVTNVAAQTISGTLNASLVAGETVEVSLDNGANWVTASSSAGSNGWSLAGQTLIAGPGQQVQVRVSDAAGNHGAVTATAYTFDQSAPTLQISSNKTTTLNSADTPLITFTFSEAPVGFTAASVTVSGGTLTGFTATANPLVYTAVFTPTAGQASGVGNISVVAGAYADAAGNSGQGAAIAPISYATVAPGVAISSSLAAIKAGDTATISFKFSSAPSGFDLSDVAVTGGTLGTLTATGNPLVFTAAFTPDAGFQGVAGISIASGSFTDGSANPGVGGALPPVAVDTVAPTLTITSDVAVANSNTTALITFTFSEAPANFNLGAVSASNGTLSNLVQSSNPLVYTAVFTPAAGVAGANANISVAAGAYTDLVGNQGLASNTPALTVDTVAPVLAGSAVLFSTDSGASATDLVTNTAAQTISGTLAGGTLAVNDVVEVSLDDGVTWLAATGSVGSTSWSLAGQDLSLHAAAGTGIGAVQVRVSDGAGNHGAVTSYTYVLDTSVPTATLSSDVANLRTGQSAVISITFSEPPTGLTIGDLAAVGGTLSGFTATANPLVYTVVLTPTPGFAGVAGVTLNTYQDAAGNVGVAASTPAINIDTQAPQLAIVASTTALKAGDTATLTFIFDKAPVGFDLADISASNGTLSNFTALAGGLSYSVTFTPTAGLPAGTAVVSVAAGVYTDAAGNLGRGATAAPIAIDTLAPTTTGASVVFSADNGISNTDLLTNVAAQVISGTVNAPLAAGELVEVSLDGGVSWLAALTIGASSWSLAPQILAGSAVQVRVSDAAGNHGPVYTANYVLDVTPPSVAITSSTATLRAGETATLTYTFSEVPVGFTLAALTPFNGTLANFAVTADPLVYTVEFTPAAGLAGAAGGVDLAAGAYTDRAGNAGTGGISPLITVDSTPPQLQITSNSSTLGVGQQAVIQFSFSEQPVGFDLADIVVAGGALSALAPTGNPLIYTALFTPTAGVVNGIASISVAGGYTDAAGNPGGAAAMAPITYSTQAPTTQGAAVVFSNDTGLSNTDLVTNDGLQTISGTLSASLAAGEVVEISLNNGLSWLPVTAAAGSNSWATATPVLLAGSGTVQVRVADSVGNHGPVWGASYTVDVTPATATISSDLAALRAGESATLTFTFSEVPQGFSAASLAVVGGTVSGLAVTADPTVYTAVLTPTPGYSGAASVTLPAGSYSDAAGNQGQAAALAAVTVDALAPTLTITSSTGQLRFGETALITFAFSEAPLGFDAADISVSNGTLTGFAATSDPLVFTAVFTPTSGVATASAAISVPPAAFTDLAGNIGAGASGPAIAIETLPPANAALGQPSFSTDTGVSSNDLVTSVAAQVVSGTLALPLASGSIVQVSFDDGANWLTASIAVGSTDWTLAHTLTGSGLLRVRVLDANGNSGVESVNPYAYDPVPPTLVITSNVAVANSVEPTIITFTFSKPPIGFSAANLVVSGGVLGALTATDDPSVFTATFTPPAGVGAGTATIAVTGNYTDLAGNGGSGASLPSLQIDTVPPTTVVGAGVQFSADNGVPGDLITNIAQQTISGSLSALLASDELVQVSLDGGQSWATASVSGLTWSLTGLIAPGSNTLVVRVADLAGNYSAAQSAAYTIDTVAPTVAITSAAVALQPGQSTTITFSFSEAPQGFTAASPVVAGGVLSDVVATANPNVYTAVFTADAGYEGAAGVSLAPGSYTDLAGNAGTGAALAGLAVDGSAPTVTITSDSAALLVGQSALITFTFSEATQGFGADDVVVSGGVLSGFAATANPLVYTAVFTPTAGVNGGSASIAVTAGGYTDLAGNLGAAAAGPAIAFDTLAPLSAAVGSPRFSADTGASSTDLITSVAAQTVTGDLSLPLDAGESVQLSFDDGATWFTASVAAGATSWSFDHTLTGAGVLRVRVVDAAGNASAATATPYALDQDGPTVTITSSAPVANGVAPTLITFTFSEPPAGFSSANVVVTGGVLGPLTATDNPNVYTATFTPPAGVPAGTATIAVTGGYTDAAGNGGSAGAIPSLQIDTVPPTTVANGGIVFSNDTGVQGDLITNSPVQNLSGTLSAPLAAGDVVQVSVDSGQTWTQAVVNGLNWTVAGAVLVGSNNLVVQVADAAGNVSAAYSTPYVVDTVAPTVTVTSNIGALAPGESATLTFTLSEAGVLTLGNIVVTGGTLSNFNGSGSSYTATLTATGTGAVSVSVPGQVFTDIAGNSNAASAPLVLPPGQLITVDGVEVRTASAVDPRTGLATRTVSVPVITTARDEDESTPHPTLADIPLGIAANADGVGSTLTISVPLGVGFEASTPSVLLSGTTAAIDLIGRIEDHTTADATRAAMEAQARQFLATQGADELQQNGTLRLSGNSTVDNTWLLVTGDTSVQAGTLATNFRASTFAAGDATAAAVDLNTEIALVIDARALGGVGLQIDDVDFAAIIGAARVTGGAGQNFIIGDDAAQHITLTTGSDDDVVYGNGGDDIIGTGAGNDHLDGGDGDDILFGGAGNDVLVAGAGNDVLQGGRTDSGLWRFLLKADGSVVAVHQAALLDPVATQTVTAAELNTDMLRLKFADADVAKLETLSLLYHAAFDRDPDIGGLSYWSSLSMTAPQYATAFLTLAEGRDQLMSLSNSDYVATLMRHTLDREPTAAELAPYVLRLDAAQGDINQRGLVMSELALSATHKANWWTADGLSLGLEMLTQEQGWFNNSGDDRLVVGSGANLLVGGDGTDTAVFTGAASGYKAVLGNSFSNGTGSYDVLVGQAADSMNTVRGIELGEFDGGVVRDLRFTQASSASLQEIGMLYQITLNRAGDYTGFQHWLAQGTSGAALAQGFTGSVEFQQRYGALDDTAFITLMYQNGLDAGPDAATLARWDAYLDNHSRADMVAQLAVDATLIGHQSGTNGLTLIADL